MPEVKFCKNKKTYVGNFLVCTNIGYDGVLGWDFLVHGNLDLRGKMFRGTRSYHLVGSHVKKERPENGNLQRPRATVCACDVVNPIRTH